MSEKVANDTGDVEGEAWSADVATEIHLECLSALDAAHVAHVVAVRSARCAEVNVDEREANAEASRRVTALAHDAQAISCLSLLHGTTGAEQRLHLDAVKARADEAWARAGDLVPKIATTHPLARGVSNACDIPALAAELAGHIARTHGALAPAPDAPIIRASRQFTEAMRGLSKRLDAANPAPAEDDELEELVALARDCRDFGRMAAAPIIVFSEAVRLLRFHRRAYEAAAETDSFPWYAVAAAQCLATASSDDGVRDIARKVVVALGWKVEEITLRTRVRRSREKAAKPPKKGKKAP